MPPLFRVPGNAGLVSFKNDFRGPLFLSDGGETRVGVVPCAALALVLRHLVVWGFLGRLVSPTGVYSEELEDVTVSGGGDPAAGTASFRIVRDRDKGRKGGSS